LYGPTTSSVPVAIISLPGRWRTRSLPSSAPSRPEAVELTRRSASTSVRSSDSGVCTPRLRIHRIEHRRRPAIATARVEAFEVHAPDSHRHRAGRFQRLLAA
jgi:hypothetical protein